ncbi:MAG: DNA mismatch repair protein MutS [Bacillota bacterium]|nr:DNA mismatch repair protein MutS [Bacillota bacterium]
MAIDITTVFIILAVFGCLVAISLSSRIQNNLKIKNNFRSLWGQIPEGKYKPEDIPSIASYFNNISQENSNRFLVDDITWNDLDMDKIFMRINNTGSSVGEEFLYYLLRDLSIDGQELHEKEAFIDLIQNNNSLREQLQFIFAKLGKKRGINLSNYIYNVEKKSTWKFIIYRLLSLIPILSIFIIILNKEIGITLFALSFISNSIIYYLAKSELSTQLDAINRIVALVNCASKISKIDKLKNYTASLLSPLKNVSKLNKLSFTLISASGDPITEYLKIALLKDLIDYEKIMSILFKHKDDLKEIYKALGYFDSMISIVSYRKSLSYYCIPQLEKYRSGERRFLCLKEVYHPLIKDPVTNSIESTTPALLTGSNASGKSTFLKTIAINAIMAQTINMCLAKEYSGNYFLIYSSMALKDNLSNNESYYIAEIKSLKRILDSLNDELPCLCVIDEVLRGTNTIERIAASTQVLGYIAKRNSLCMAATHDIELTHILESHFTNYHFQEKVCENEVQFDYKLYEGRSTSRNAIKLLKLLGYNDTIVDEAENCAGAFEREGFWRKYMD